MLCLDARRPPLEELYPDDDLEEMDPILRGNQGYRLWYLSCQRWNGRGVYNELDDGTRIDFRVTKPHVCVPDDIAKQAKRVEDVIVEEASDPAAVLSLRSIHEAHTQNLEPLVRARVRTVLQLKNKMSKRRKKRVPPR